LKVAHTQARHPSDDPTAVLYIVTAVSTERQRELSLAGRQGCGAAPASVTSERRTSPPLEVSDQLTTFLHWLCHAYRSPSFLTQSPGFGNMTTGLASFGPCTSLAYLRNEVGAIA